jgi:SAM-dependent methyltransferase
MTSSPHLGVVSNQYERWMYPQPILDIPTWLASNWQWFDPSHAHRLLWPDRGYRPGMDILVAGCGTNQAAIIAFTNPTARGTAIDVSQPSLDHHSYLKSRYEMKNLELNRLAIEDVESLGRDFDLVISTGVLHHLADPAVGMAALGRCLRADGVAAVMLYARYGRTGVEMVQGAFRDLGLGQSDASLLIVREALALLPQDHPVKSYLAIAPDLNFDAGIVDTFLHGRERSYTIDDCLELVSGAGLVFQDLFLKAPYYPPSSPTNVIWHAISKLPRERQWAVMERVNVRNGCHFFTACRRERPVESYLVDFNPASALGYVPSLRYRCALSGRQLSRHNWSMTLDTSQRDLVQCMDGQRTIAAIAAGAAQDVTTAFATFRSLWQLDMLDIMLK